MEEYEYSYNVTDIKPYIDFCEKNNYKKISETSQRRRVFENIHNRSIISRLTTKDDETVIDFKNTNVSNNNLKISTESKSMIVDDSNKDFFDSLLTTLDFEQSADNYRIRYVYKKGKVKFEIDNYTSPKMYVLAVEGERTAVDKVIEELKELNDKYKINGD